MRILRVVVCVGVLAACWGRGARVWASCPDHVAMGHFFDSYFACDDGVQTAGFSYQQSDPLNVNTGTAQIACQGFAPDEDSFCPMSSGVFGDQRLAIGADWMSGGMIGCPIAESVPRRIVIAVVAPGPLVSSGLLVSLSGADTGLGYAVEAAHPLDASQTQILPAACATTLQLVNATGLRLTTRSTLPPLFTDCDTNSAGQVLASTCPDDFHPVASFGFLYTKVVPCGYIPEIRTSAWTNTGVVPDADGDATVTVDPAPRPGECVLVGGTTMLDGVETASLTGYVQPDIDCVDSDGDGVSDCVDNCPTVPNFDQNPCACAQCPAVEGLTVDFSNPIGKGSGVVSWSTAREFDVVGFNIVTIDGKGTRTQLNPALIHCEECVTGAGHFYSYVIPKHKNGHNMFLEVLFLQGTVRLAGPAQKIH